MDQFNELRKCMFEVEERSDFKGYWFRICDVLSIIVCGMLCGLENMSEIYDWATANPVRVFLAEQISIAEIPCKAQFYNILDRVNAEQFGKSFIKWMQYVLQGGVAGKTARPPHLKINPKAPETAKMFMPATSRSQKHA